MHPITCMNLRHIVCAKETRYKRGHTECFHLYAICFLEQANTISAVFSALLRAS